MELSEATRADDRVGGLHAHLSVYKQLPVNESRTRVIVLHSPSSNEAPVSCSLEVMTLNPEPSRAYMALSYVWGDASVTEDIIVNGIPFAVTSNLVSALRQIRKSFGEVCLWADALCKVRVCPAQPRAQLLISCIGINQRDISERNQQVLLMRSIYTKTERVIGWLGQDENGGSKALKTLETLFRIAIQYPENFEWIQKIPELVTVNGTFNANGTEFQSNDRLESLLLLLKRPFWRRIWIVQELVLPSCLTLLCGEEFTDIPEPESFFITVEKLSKLPARRPNSAPLQMWMRLNECVASLRLIATLRVRHLRQEAQVDREWQGVSGFLRSRVLLEFHETSDFRDHVYGLLGVFELGVLPDYSEDMTFADAYLEVARHCLETESLDKTNAIDILCYAGTKHSCNGLDCLTCFSSPSWVPDWSLPIPARVRHHRYPQSHAFRSDRGLQMQVIDRKSLRGSVVVWDTITSTEHKTGWDLQELDLAEKFVFEKHGDRSYPSGISRCQAIVLLWVAGHDGFKRTPCDLLVECDLFRSYQMIQFANIVAPWSRKHGQLELAKLTQFLSNDNGSLSLMNPRAIPRNHRESYVARSRQVRYDMRCFHTGKGYIGLGPLTTVVGDLVCVLEGHKAPVVLRRRNSHYILVGDCDVVGIMNGEVLEAVKRGEAEVAEIEIR